MVDYKSILVEADSLVNGERQEQYGDPIKNWKETAEIASAITGEKLSPQTCVLVLVAAKLARERHAHKRDSLVDAVGYLDILNRLQEVDNVH